MKNLISKYHLIIDKGPLPISNPTPFSIDEKAVEKPFHIHSNPVTSFSDMFPLDVELPKNFNLYLLTPQKDVLWTHNFLADVEADNSLILVGIQGIILLGLNYYHDVPRVKNGKSALSPAYYFNEARVRLNNIQTEAQIPYFFKNDKGSIGIGYSHTAACALSKGEPILIGNIM